MLLLSEKTRNLEVILTYILFWSPMQPPFRLSSLHLHSTYPISAVKIDGINKQLPGTADILKPDFTGGTCHRNLQFSIEIVNDKVARNLIVFDKLLTTVLKSGEKCRMAVAYEDSEDVKKWPSRVTKILHSEYEDTKVCINKYLCH